MRKHILIVDDNVTNLKIAEKTLSEDYRVTLLISGAQTLKFLKKNRPDLILLDINMPEMDGYEIIKLIKGNKELKSIPVIFLTAQLDGESEVKGINLGAIDFIRKPFIPEAMRSRIRLHLEFKEYKLELEEKVKEKTEIIEHLHDVIISSLAELVECRDENTGGHVKRTAKYVEILTKELMKRNEYVEILTEEYAYDVIRSAPLHDIGKIGINDKTLLKNGSLDRDEFEFMKQHTTLGGRALQKMIDETSGETFLYVAKDMALSHHEKWDGTGYPNGIKGEEIPLCARIMAIGDVYDALTTRRPYKEPFTHKEAIEIILEGRDKNFDPKIIDIFNEINEEFKKVKEEIEDESFCS